MAADAGDAGIGQRWYIQAARLAEEAGDGRMRATALRSLAVQAVERGHGKYALDLAEAASRMGSTCPLRTRAWLTGMHAEALAAVGDGRRARATLRLAERYLDHADSTAGDLIGNFRRESLDHQTGTSLAFLGDLAGAEEHFAASVCSRRPVERRTRALIGARLAVVQHHRGHDDAAADTLQRIKDDLQRVSSGRVTATLARLPDTLRVNATSARAI